MSDRRNEILKAALELYNKNGLEQVTTRDIARKIKISPGNLTYHFPTRNDIVLALMSQLSAEIDAAMNEPAAQVNSSVLAFYYRQCKTIIKNQIRYEFLFNKQYAQVVTSQPDMQALLQKVLVLRFDQWQHFHERLVKEGLALAALKKESHAQAHLVNITALYWHQEVAIYFPSFNDQQKVDHALSLIFQLYKPYLTKKGLAELPALKKLKHYREG